MYVSGFAPYLEGWNPEWAKRFDQLYGYNPTKAKELLKAAGYPAGTLKVKLLAYTEPGEAELPQVAEAVACISMTWAFRRRWSPSMRRRSGAWVEPRKSSCCMWPNIIGLRPTEEWIRTAHYSKTNAHIFEDEFLEKK